MTPNQEKPDKGKRPENVSEEEWNRTNADYSAIWNSAKVPEDGQDDGPKRVNIAEEEWNRENNDSSKIWKMTGLEEDKDEGKKGK